MTTLSNLLPPSNITTADKTQTLTNKTLTSPAITGGTASGLTLNDGQRIHLWPGSSDGLAAG